MRILLVAYDFAPSASPQSLRWAYLARELIRCGHRVEVVTPDTGRREVPGALPVLPATLDIHRVFPGPVSAALFYRRQTPVPSGNGGSFAPGGHPDGVRPTRLTRWVRWLLQPLNRFLAEKPDVVSLNWKGLLEAYAKGLFSRCLYPDHRAEWLPWARLRVIKRLKRFKPDVVVTSHEPSSSIALGLLAKHRGHVWIADLGDPVLSSYTPTRWSRTAGNLEQKTCRLADLVTVTTDGTKDLLRKRHDLPPERIEVIPQGFDPGQQVTTLQVPAFNPALLELVYTGSLYSFRSIEPLVDVIARLNGVRLTVASGQCPAYFERMWSAYPEKFRYLGFQPHLAAMELQRQADVLVDVANDDPVQVPGKLFEYFQARKPILHLTWEQQDAASRFLDANRIGWSILPASAHLQAFLLQVQKTKVAGKRLLDDPDWSGIEPYRWERLAEQWVRKVSEIVACRASVAGAADHE